VPHRFLDTNVPVCRNDPTDEQHAQPEAAIAGVRIVDPFAP
jgi:hypothetical protein